MILKSFYFILVSQYISVLSHKTKFIVPNILKNNYDLEEMKKVVQENEEVHEFGKELNKSQLNKSQKITYKQLIELENKFDDYYEKHNLKETVRHFYLFTRNYHEGVKYELLDPWNVSTIKNSHFKTRPTFIVVHGFLGNGLEPWVLSLKDDLLKKEDCNVISVDWPAGHKWLSPLYILSAGKVPYVGNDTAYLIESLMTHKGLSLETTHCVGHSLGAHICGFSAKPYLGRMGRISGLDPAGPCFHNLNSSSRLDKSDAIYVDVIHTNACNKSLFDFVNKNDCFGLDENIGHSNFFPNGGQHQPACTRKHKAITGDIGCDHEMAYMYYISSLNFSPSTTFFLARPCEDWVLYEIGNCSCGKNAQYMGFNVNSELEGSFYLETLSTPPFAKEDTGCSAYRPHNILVIILYVCIGLFVIFITGVIVALVIENIKRTCCSSPRDEEDPLVSSDEDTSSSSSDGDTTEDEEEAEDKPEMNLNVHPNNGVPSVISS